MALRKLMPVTVDRATYQRPWMYAKQEAAIFQSTRTVVVEASTKSGKTVGCIVWLAEQAMAGQAGRNYWWVAPIYPQARIAYRRLKHGLPPSIYAANESELTLTLGNGAVLWFKSADKPDSLYGEDVYAAVIDEASRCKEDAWYAVRSTLTATRGPVRIIGNVKGRKNWAYQLARMAESGAPGMAYAKITAQDAISGGVIGQAEVDDARRVLPADVYRELYEAEPSDDAGNPFGLAAIRAQMAPLSAAPPVAWGVDLAKAQDWTVAIGLDAAGAVCRFERWQGPWNLTVARLAPLLGNTPTLVDSTGVGDPILERLQADAGQYVQGFQFTAPSKQKLMEGLAVAIQQGEIHYPEGPIVQELETFEYTYTRTGVHYSAPDGLHEDCVCALALAVQRWKHQPSAWEFF
jgi:hypothetical protein